MTKDMIVHRSSALVSPSLLEWYLLWYCLARLLLGRGAAVHCARPDGDTPLHLACDAGHEPVAHLLARGGADLAARSHDETWPRRSPRDFICYKTFLLQICESAK